MPVLVLDKRIKPGNLVEFMEWGARQLYVIVVHSGRYWESPTCAFELRHIQIDLMETATKSRRLNVIPVEHQSSRVRFREGPEGRSGLNGYLQFWRDYKGDLPARFAGDRQTFIDDVVAAINYFGTALSREPDFGLLWRVGEKSVTEAIAKRLTAAASDDGRAGRPTR